MTSAFKICEGDEHTYVKMARALICFSRYEGKDKRLKREIENIKQK
jgi:hypothetical protein